MKNAPLLVDAIPELAKELETLLTKEGESALAVQIRQVSIVDRCRCDASHCATFYTAPPPSGAYGKGHRCVDLGCQTGMLILDVVNDKVMAVEVLYRDDIRQRLQEILP